MQADHVIRYGAGNAYSMVILQFLHFGEIRVPRRSLPGTIMFWLRVWLRMSAYDRRMELAMHRARQRGVRAAPAARVFVVVYLCGAGDAGDHLV